MGGRPSPILAHNIRITGLNPDLGFEGRYERVQTGNLSLGNNLYGERYLARPALPHRLKRPVNVGVRLAPAGACDGFVGSPNAELACLGSRSPPT